VCCGAYEQRRNNEVGEKKMGESNMHVEARIYLTITVRHSRDG
jgi:hypothetical protein